MPLINNLYILFFIFFRIVTYMTSGVVSQGGLVGYSPSKRLQILFLSLHYKYLRNWYSNSGEIVKISNLKVRPPSEIFFWLRHCTV